MCALFIIRVLYYLYSCTIKTALNVWTSKCVLAVPRSRKEQKISPLRAVTPAVNWPSAVDSRSIVDVTPLNWGTASASVRLPSTSPSLVRVASNCCSSSSHSKWSLTNICSLDKPDPPAKVPAASDIRRSSLTLSWYGPTYDGGSAVRAYHLEIWDSVEQQWNPLVSCNSTSYNVQVNVLLTFEIQV